ncbi:thioredoxin domain-containing protein [soil metagenome]
MNEDHSASRGTEAHLPDIRQALDWRAWEDGLEEARGRQLPMLCLAEAPWVNSAQRLALVLGRDEALRRCIRASFMPVLLDPWERPDLAARLRLASVALTGTAGPPLLALLTHEGLPFLSYPCMWPEGREPYPSLLSLLRSVSESYGERRDALALEARALQAGASGGSAFTSFQGFWEGAKGELDGRHGGLRELPKHPNVPLLWLLLGAAERGFAPARDHLLKTLEGMTKGGLLDQLGGSFHRCARDARWVVPHFEKPVPVNAGLAAVSARAATLFDRPDFAEVAEGAARFALVGLENEVIALASDTRYYTWTSEEVMSSLEPALVQVLGLHFHLTPHPSPQVLYRALEPEAMAAQGLEPELARARLEAGKAQLGLIRAQRRSPELVTAQALSWQAESLRWLLEAAGCGLEFPHEALFRLLEALVARPFDAFSGYGRTAGEGWREEQASVCLACLGAHRLTGASGHPGEEHLEAARRAADAVLTSYLDARTGTLSDRPGSPVETQDVVDHELSSAVGMTLGALVALARTEEGGRYLEAARAVARRYEGTAKLAGARASAFWRARLDLT